MWKIYFCCLLLVSFCTVGLVMAGEKEELQLRVQMLQERLARIQLEFKVTQTELRDALDALKKLPPQPPPKEGQPK